MVENSGSMAALNEKEVFPSSVQFEANTRREQAGQDYYSINMIPNSLSNRGMFSQRKYLVNNESHNDDQMREAIEFGNKKVITFEPEPEDSNHLSENHVNVNLQLKLSSHTNSDLIMANLDERDKRLCTTVSDFLIMPEIYSLVCNSDLQGYLVLYREYGSLIGLEKSNISNVMSNNSIDIPSTKKVKIVDNYTLSKGHQSTNKVEPKTKGKNLSGFPESVISNRQSKNKSSLKASKIQNHDQQNKLEFTGPGNTKIEFRIEEFVKIIKEYVVIGIFMAQIRRMATMETILCDIFKNMEEIDSDFVSSHLLVSSSSLEILQKRILQFNETLLFTEMLNRITDLNLLLTPKMFAFYIMFNRYELLKEFYEKYDQQIKMKVLSTDILTAIEKLNMNESAAQEEEYEGSKLTREKVILLIKNYFLAKDDDELCMKILKDMGFKPEHIVMLLMDTKEQERVITILQTHPILMKCIDINMVLKKRLFKLIILFDGMELINIFNMRLREDTKITVYQQICFMIEKGDSVEALCNIVTHVSETFWDQDKLLKFFKSLNNTLKNNKSDWLAYIQNPLLFCMTLVSFFKKLKLQLDYKDHDIIDLSEGMLNFCKIYIENASDESLNINLFDVDSKGYGFLDYAFYIKDMTVLETEQVEGKIQQQWDFGRHTMQTIIEFMRMKNMKDSLKNFSIDLFTKDHSTPIEDDDSFQMEFRYCSSSVKMKVLSLIYWPVTLAVFEFIFSMDLVQLRLRNEFDSDWLYSYYSKNEAFFLVHTFLRASFVLSSLIRTLTLKSILREVNYLQVLYNITIAISFVQYIIYPLFFFDQFWFINISQMLMFISLIAYILMNCLSLNEYGVILRIFARMSYVVVIFGTVSVVLITVIAYPIHVIFINFTQQVEGQIYTDLNLFSDLYQGILTCFEFVFGAVVLVRPYQEQNFYTYSMTFIMMMFSFFGNIMLANLLVAFLTSQFDEINQNAKYLTMNMQFGLIKVLKNSRIDSVLYAPYVLTLPFLPFYLWMYNTKKHKKSINRWLKFCIHVLNTFLPTCLFMLCYLLLLSVYRYLFTSLKLFLKIVISPMNALYLLLWIVAGPFFLIKIWYQDVSTMCVIMLSMKKSEPKGVEQELSEHTKKNLVSLFGKFNRIVLNQLQFSTGHIITVRQFLEAMGIINIQDILIKKAFSGGDDNGADNLSKSTIKQNAVDITTNIDYLETLELNSKYNQDEKILTLHLLKKFAVSESGSNDQLLNMDINLNFMREKFRNNIKVENISRLISFEKNTLDKASEFLLPSRGEEVEKEISEIHSKMNQVNGKMESILLRIRNSKNLLR